MKLTSNAGNRKGYRLPTEAEWEFSCRAGASTEYSFGEPWELLEKYMWYYKNSPSRSQPVGSLKPNDLGLFDLHGNLWEWRQESMDELEKERRTTQINISTSVTYEHPRFLRGGTFVDLPALVRSAYRNWNAPANRNSDYGFRPSRTYH